MVRLHLTGINTSRKRLADGTVKKYYYHRGTGKPIIGKPGTPEFVASYAEAAQREATDTGTFASLITGFVASPEFQKLAEKTRKDYRRYLDALRDEFGSLPIDALSDRRIRQDFFDWRDQYANKPRTADYAWSILRRVLSWAYDRGKIDVNHAINPGRLYDSDRSDLIWLPEHVAAFCKVASDELKLALVLAISTGQRQGDLLKMTWGQYDGQWINHRQSKGKKRVSVPDPSRPQEGAGSRSPSVAPDPDNAHRRSLEVGLVPKQVAGCIRRGWDQRPALPRPAWHCCDDAGGSWLHAAGDSGNHRSLPDPC